MLLLIDNYDSFTFNLVHYCQELGADVTIYRNDALGAADALALNPSHIMLSPGPCTPSESGVCLDLIPASIQHNIPLLGVCLGHQAIGQVMGGQVVRTHPMHGKTDTISHTGESVFKGLPSPFRATRYHSLMVARDKLPSSLRITAQTPDGVIMGLMHVSAPVHGVQFHPESIMTEHGYQMLQNFLQMGSRPCGKVSPDMMAERNAYLSALQGLSHHA